MRYLLAFLPGRKCVLWLGAALLTLARLDSRLSRRFRHTLR